MSVKTLSRISQVDSTNDAGEANDLLKRGWVLLSVESVGIDEGADSFVRTKYVLGRPSRDVLDD